MYLLFRFSEQHISDSQCYNKKKCLSIIQGVFVQLKNKILLKNLNLTKVPFNVLQILTNS